MNPRIEALLAVDPHELTDTERAALDKALAADEDAQAAALLVALDAEVVDDTADPLVGPVPSAAAVAPAPARRWFAVAAAVMLVVAAIALIVLLRSSSAPSDTRTVEQAPRQPAPILDERKAPAPAPPDVARDELRALPIGAARPRPLRAKPTSKKAARAHAARGLEHKKAGEHLSAAFAYVDAFRALPGEPALAYTAAAEMERAGLCADAIAWFRFAVSLDPGAKFARDANERVDALDESCDRDRVVAVTGPDAAEARARFEHGRTLYAAGDYRGAARMFGGAYLGYPVPEIAYNVAASYHRSDDCANAVAWFRHYLDVATGAEDRAAVEKMIAVYDGVGCDDRVTHAPPRSDDVDDPKRQFTMPKDVEFPGDEKVSSNTLADEASDEAKKGNYGTAYKKCEGALALDPNMPKARIVCVIASCKLKNAKRARKHYAHLSDSSKRAVVQLCGSAGIDLTGDEAPAVDESLPERLSRTDLTTVMGRARGRISECGIKGGYTGTIKVTMRIDPDGRVAQADASESNATGRCVENIIRTLQFPHAQQPITVNYPFVFR